jgi:hypothetical protein
MILNYKSEDIQCIVNLARDENISTYQNLSEYRYGLNISKSKRVYGLIEGAMEFG